MATKKRDFHKEFNNFLEQAKEGFKKLGKEVSVIAKKSEQEITKASKKGKIQLDIVGINMQKEKLYYDIGKKAVSLNSKKSLGIPALDSYFNKIRSLESGARKKKREFSMVKNSGK